MNKFIVLIILCLGLTFQAQAQGIKGKISNTKGEAVPYASIYVSELYEAATSNADGDYILSLPKGEWEINIRFIGYQTIKQKIKVDDSTQRIDFVMAEQAVQLEDVRVLASGEDPAYYVIRRAIAMATYYRNQIDSYTCNAYVKGSGYVYKIPRMIRAMDRDNTIELNKTYVSESISKISYKDGVMQQEVEMVHASMLDSLGTGESVPFVPLSLYSNWDIDVGNDGEMSIISPVDKNALRVYEFTLLGTFIEGNKTINKIQVTPKVAGKSKFSGTINIVEDYWNIHSANLSFTIPFADIEFKQYYTNVADNVWMPTSNSAFAKLHAFGVKAKMDYAISMTDYDVVLNPNINHSFLDEINSKRLDEIALRDSLSTPEEAKIISYKDGEISKNQQKINKLITDEKLNNRKANKLNRLMEKETKGAQGPKSLEVKSSFVMTEGKVVNDTAKWNKLRPMPLSTNEQEGFSTALTDTTAKKSSYSNKKRSTMHQIAFGASSYPINDDERIYWNGFLPFSDLKNKFSYSTVDGLAYSLPVRYSSRSKAGKSIYLKARASYGFKSRNVYGYLDSFKYTWDGIKRQGLAMGGGRKLTDYKGDKGLSTIENSIYTLLFENNMQKFYDKRYIYLNFFTDITNGLALNAGFEYAQRLPLENNTSWKMINWSKRSFTPNVPDIPEASPERLSKSNSSKLKLSVAYTPEQYYAIKNNRKVIRHSRFPTFMFDYTKGINNFISSDVDYDLLQLSVKQKFKAGANANIKYLIKGGAFANNKKLYANDFVYTITNDEYLTSGVPFDQFNTAAYYELYSIKNYVEVHGQLDANMILLKRLPLLNKTLVRESLSLHFYDSESTKDYLEVGYGLNNIFWLINLSVNYGLSDWSNDYWGFRIGISLL